MTICEPVRISVPVKDLKTPKLSHEDAGCFPPHLMFSTLEEHHPMVFQEMFGLKDCETFWQGVEETQDDRLIPPERQAKHQGVWLVGAPLSSIAGRQGDATLTV